MARKSKGKARSYLSAADRREIARAVACQPPAVKAELARMALADPQDLQAWLATLDPGEIRRALACREGGRRKPPGP